MKKLNLRVFSITAILLFIAINLFAQKTTPKTLAKTYVSTHATKADGDAIRDEMITALQTELKANPALLNAVNSGTVQTWLGASSGALSAISAILIGAIEDDKAKQWIGVGAAIVGVIVGATETGLGLSPPANDANFVALSVKAINRWNKKSAKHSANATLLKKDLQKLSTTAFLFKTKYASKNLFKTL